MRQTSTNAHRRSTRSAIAEHLRAHVGEPLNSAELHIRFGSSLRARISELHLDPDSGLLIRDYTHCSEAGEVSIYTATLRVAQPTLFPMERQHQDLG